jgi:hypothetical protein
MTDSYVQKVERIKTKGEGDNEKESKDYHKNPFVKVE